MKVRNKAVSNAILLVLTLLVNLLGALGIINGYSQKEVSDKFITLITPSPQTFSIWSLIYVLLIVAVIVMIINRNDPYYRENILRISAPFKASCIFNILWIVSFSFLQVELGFLFIIGLLISLLVLLQRILKVNTKKKILLPLTFGIYTGWIFIASFVNLGSALVKNKWSGFGLSEEIWAVIALIIAVLIALLIIKKNKNAVFTLPIAWAYLGIYNSLRSMRNVQDGYMLLEITTIVAMCFLIGFAIYRFYKNDYRIIPDNNTIE